MRDILGTIIAVCLIAQSKADVYNVNPIRAYAMDHDLGVVSEENDTTVIRIEEDIDKPQIAYKIYDHLFNEIENRNIYNACDTNASTQDGSLSAILLQSLDLTVCPYSIGNYTLAGRFNYTGAIHVFEYKNQTVTINYKLLNDNTEPVFTLFADVRLLETDSSKDDENPSTERPEE